MYLIHGPDLQSQLVHHSDEELKEKVTNRDITTHTFKLPQSQTRFFVTVSITNRAHRVHQYNTVCLMILLFGLTLSSVKSWQWIRPAAPIHILQWPTTGRAKLSETTPTT